MWSTRSRRWSPWPLSATRGPDPRPVPAGHGEPEHEHADLRYLLATARPEDAIAETAAARLRWLSIPDAMAAVAEDNLRVTFERVAKIVAEHTN